MYSSVLLATPRLIVQPLEREHIPHIIAYYLENKDYLSTFEPLRAENFYTAEYWNQIMDTISIGGNHSLRFLIFHRDNLEKIIGVINVTNITRGAFHACNIGYNLASTQTGNGYMTEALKVVIDYLFQKLNIHRIQANYLPHNQKSAKLLKSLGFRIEGYAYDYLMINGKWEDHILSSLVNNGWKIS